MAGHRIVMATVGSEGDVHPFIGVALALKARGHEPIIATRSAFQAKIEREGLGFRPMRPDTDDVEAIGLPYDEIVAGITDQATGLRFLIKRIVAPFIRETYADLEAASEGADLIISHNLVLAAPLLAAKRGLPWMTAILQPFSFMSTYDAPALGVSPLLDFVRRAFPPPLHRLLYRFAAQYSGSWFEPVHRFRAELGLPPSPLTPILEGPYSPLGTIALYSKVLGVVQRDFPPSTAVTGFPFYDSETGGGSQLDARLAGFLDQGPAPVVFTLGTSAVLNPGTFFADSLDAAARLNRRAVLLVGQDGFKALAEPLPHWAIACAYAPHSALFPRAEAIVHQGGVGTTGQALRSGRPQLVTPHMADQPDNAARLVRLGVARTLNPKHYTADSASRAIADLVARPAYRAAAQAAAAAVAEERGAKLAADVIERVIRR